MASSDTIGVFNNTQRLIVLKGIVPLTKEGVHPKRFRDTLQPGVLNFVPKAFWSIYKRNKVTKIYLEEEKLMVNKMPKEAKEKVSSKSSAKIQQEATLQALAEVQGDNAESDDSEE